MTHPEESTNLLRQGIRAYHDGDYTKAAKLFYKATRRDSTNQIAWIWLAGCINDQEKQRMCYQTALDIDPTSREGQLAAAALSKLPPSPGEEVVPPPPVSMAEQPAPSPSVMPQNKPIQRVQPDFISLTCPKCGGQLDVTNDIERFACGYCGTEHIVRRSGGTIALQPVVVGLQKIQYGTDRTASELAIVRLEKEIGALEAKLSAVLYEEQLLYTPTYLLTQEERMQQSALIMRYRTECPHLLPTQHQTLNDFHEFNAPNNDGSGCLLTLAIGSLFMVCSTAHNSSGTVAIFFVAAIMFFLGYLVVKSSSSSTEKPKSQPPSDPPLRSATIQQQLEEKRAELREHQRRVKL